MVAKRFGTLALALGVALTMSAGPAFAHDDTEYVDDGVMDSGKETHTHDAQHGGDEGHLPASSSNVVEIGNL
ncbi:hypothetical protein, partial [Pseudolysinimonas sp.]|uniref:hypothetical protein n=1 Tax=Pseudolysinimonas sp. TaxID=2680009 RepID=UPI00286BF9E6